jgi:hypothetical protein
MALVGMIKSKQVDREFPTFGDGLNIHLVISLI